ncbi:hypothetical protein [Dyella japonica]|uniref:Uncharacterized protein n=1 Tax=Dyella japonica TaxID=231455 RepID=A0ABV2JYS8_9GAMM
MTTLYAWATPAFSTDSPVDHTFVTDYDNRVDVYPSIEKVEQAQANYWYCWGIFHAQGDSSQQPQGYLGSANGNFSLAQCLCLPNKASDSIDPHIRPNACGTIYHYGLDGVCHQLANQVLWATGGASTAPLTVALARGYRASSFIYGTYGILHLDWKANISRCAAAPPSPSSPSAVTTMNANDDFAIHAQKVLAALNASDKLAPLLALRDSVREEQLAQRETLLRGAVMPSAEALNARNQAYFRRAEALLTSAEFEAVFGFAPGRTIDLVDADIARKPPGGTITG